MKIHRPAICSWFEADLAGLMDYRPAGRGGWNLEQACKDIILDDVVLMILSVVGVDDE